MSKDKQRLFDYLQHIVTATQRIEKYISDCDEVAFINNELIQDAVIRNIAIIGEASHNIVKHYPEYAEQHPQVPFSVAYEMRNMLAHGYFKVDLNIVWRTIETDIPELDRLISTLLDTF